MIHTNCLSTHMHGDDRERPMEYTTTAIAVKPLEWEEDQDFWRAQTNIMACYSIWDTGDHWECSLLDGKFKSVEEAKAASQKDWDSRILSALVPAPPTAKRGEVGTAAPSTNKRGIYIASKTKHADRWRFLRDKVGEPIISTWIDEAGVGETADFSDLWRRCILEASTAEVLIVYREAEDVLKGGWVEVGAALASGVTVFAVGIEDFTIAHDKRIRHFPDMKAAIVAAREVRQTPAPQQMAAVTSTHEQEGSE